MKKSISLSIMLVFVLAAFAPAASDEAKGTQTKCPVMGGKVVKTVYTDYKDQRIFFCCEPCIKEFLKDPEKNLEKIAENGETPMKLKAQSVCPVSGEELKSKDVFVDAHGKRIFVCCKGCTGKVKDDPKKYMKVIAERGEYLEDVEKKEEKY